MKPKTRMFELTEGECEGLVNHLKQPVTCPIRRLFPPESKWHEDKCKFCDKLFPDYAGEDKMNCPPHSPLVGNYWVDAIIDLLEHNDYEIPGNPEDYEAIRDFI